MNANRPIRVSRYEIRQCQRRDCRFRFPVIIDNRVGDTCPRCGAHTRLVETPYADHEVETKEIVSEAPQLEALLDNIRSVFNVGSMFRTADGVGIRHIHLCGMTPTPDNPKLTKTALGAECAVGWTQYGDGSAAATLLKKQGLRLWALEGGPRSESLFEAMIHLQGPPIVLVVGNEVSGVDPGILEQCERVLHIPMQGIKRSLNVAVAFGITVYALRYAPLIQPAV